MKIRLEAAEVETAIREYLHDLGVDGIGEIQVTRGHGKTVYADVDILTEGDTPRAAVVPHPSKREVKD